MEKSKGKPLTGFHLKLIAIITMMIDHVAHMFVSDLPMDSYQIMRLIGRIAMPVFCFMCVEGVLYTKNIKKYALRMFIFAVISEIPFNLLSTRGANIKNIENQNVMWTLLFGILMLYAIEQGKKYSEAMHVTALIVAPLIACLLAFYMKTDYGYFGILLILVLYLTYKKPLLTVIGLGLMCTVVYALIYGVGMYFGGRYYPIPNEITGVLAAVPICLYSGKQGYYNKVVKYFFYAFYPAHILIIAALKSVIH
ncbi:MAG TPA: hypothetical protein GXZ23_06800 [Clostridiales bacterium]|nr:hypothetical protein [Clostridiales bacterium]